MAKAYKCDRCGSFHDLCDSKSTYYNGIQNLCPKCYKSFEHWWLDIYYESEKEG